MRRGIHNSSRPSHDVEIDLAPMIDCIFILLIFFIVTSVFIRDPGVQVQRPDVEGSVQADHASLIVAITADDKIFFDGQAINLDDLAAILRNAHFDQEMPLIIRADRAASHGTFAEVHAAAKIAGISMIQFSTTKGI